MRNATELGWIARLPLSGQAAYRATLAFAGGAPQIGVTSTLAGMGVELPHPLGKAPAATLPLRVQIGPDEGASTATPAREAVRVDLGHVLQARFVREGEGDAQRVVRGAIRLADTVPPAGGAESVAEALPLPASGVTANAVLAKLNVDEWEAAGERLFPESTRTAAAGPDGGAGGYAPDHIGVRLGELTMSSRRLANVVAGLSSDGGLWRANVDSDELDGYIEYRHRREGATPGAPGSGRVYARLSRLSLPKGEAERVESLLDEQPASVPALDIVVDDFELRGKRLGRLEIEAVNRSTGGRDAGASGGCRSSTWCCPKRSSPRRAPGAPAPCQAFVARAAPRWTSR